MTLIVALITATWYLINMFRIGYHFTYSFGSPIILGFLLGIVYGDVATGLIIGANIQLVYLGVIVAGGNVPSDSCLAAAVAIPIALATKMDPKSAVAVAVPFGILGVFLDQFKRTTNIYGLHKADKFAETGDEKGIFRCAFTYPLIAAIGYRWLPVFLICLVGPSAAEKVLTVLPQWVVSGFALAGGILPALGFAQIIITIGRKELLPVFFIGFFLVQYLQLNMIACAIFGGCAAILYYMSATGKIGGTSNV